MDNSQFQSLTRRVAAGQASDKELDELLSALDNDQSDAMLSQAWSEAAGVVSPDTANAVWNGINARLEPAIDDAPVEETPSVRRGLFRWVTAAAVVAAIAIAAGLGWWIAKSGAVPAGEFSMTVDRGQKAQMTLPDGSRVWLNSGTTLAYDARFGADHRALRLDGEAYFDVARDPKRPFVVHAGDVAVKAMGTKFNVKAYPQDSLVTATLAHGRVEVSDGRHTLTLNPMDVATYATRSRRMELSTTDNLMLAEYWRTDRLVFDGERLGNICRTIERMYGIDISITEPRLEDIRFTGTIRNNSLSNVFLLLSLSYPLDCRIDGEHVTIEPRK